MLGQAPWETDPEREICTLLNEGSKKMWEAGLDRSWQVIQLQQTPRAVPGELRSWPGPSDTSRIEARGRPLIYSSATLSPPHCSLLDSGPSADGDWVIPREDLSKQHSKHSNGGIRASFLVRAGWHNKDLLQMNVKSHCIHKIRKK